MDMRPPKADELATMERVTAEAMEDGAFGVSFALIYPPSSYAETEEIVAVARAMRPYESIYITHLRSEADSFMEGLEEALSVGRVAEVPVQVYHLKAAGTRNWHKLASAMERISEARSQGIDITADMYSYAAAGTGLTSVLPPWAAAGDKLYENLTDPAMRAKIKEAALHPNGEWEAMADMAGPEGVMPVGFLKEENRRYVGMRLSEIAAENGVEWPDAAMDLLASEGQRISSFYFVMSEGEFAQAAATAVDNDLHRRRGGWTRPGLRPPGPIIHVRTARTHACWANTCAKRRSFRWRTRCVRCHRPFATGSVCATEDSCARASMRRGNLRSGDCRRQGYICRAAPTLGRRA